MSALIHFVRCHLVAIVLVGLVAYGIVYRDKILLSGDQVAAVGDAPQQAAMASSESAPGSSDVQQAVHATAQAPEGIELARKAYWEGEYDKAIQRYRELAEKYPQNADVFGELGDVYYQQGNKEAAGDVYYNAAKILIDHNNKARAERVLAVLRLMNSPHVEQLASRIQG